LYVQKKRYVKRRYSSRGSVRPSLPHLHRVAVKVATIGAVVAVFASVIGLLAIGGLFGAVTGKFIDPELYSLLSSGSAVAYASYTGELDLSGIQVLKTWKFGDLLISKMILPDVGALERLKRQKQLISVYAEKQFRHAPLHFVSLSQYENFSERDIDNQFHKADGTWTGEGVTVAVIDTGIDYMHPDFFDEDGRSIIKVLVSMHYVWEDNGSFVTWDLEKNPDINALYEFEKYIWTEYGSPPFLDLNGHGTHVAGTIAGRGSASQGKFIGIAPKAKLVIIKAFDENGQASIDTCLDALNWVYNYSSRYDISVLNLSWGAAFASDGTDPLSLAVDRIAVDRKVLVVAAAGNFGNLPNTVIVPAVARKAFAAGAWDAYIDKLAPFSSLGTTKDFRMKPDLAAAGVLIVSCKSRYADFPSEYVVDEDYVALSGTSMATAVTSGIAAAFVEYYKYWNNKDPDPSDFQRWIEENSRHFFYFKDFVTGWGIPYAPHS